MQTKARRILFEVKTMETVVRAAFGEDDGEEGNASDNGEDERAEEAKPSYYVIPSLGNRLKNLFTCGEGTRYFFRSSTFGSDKLSYIENFGKKLF